MKVREMSPVLVRVPPEFKAVLVAEAKKHRRSLNGEIGMLMEEALNARAKQSAA